MKETAVVERALIELFAQLDHEHFDRVAELLHPDAELADELTGEWLRGSDRVAAYLLAQSGVVTDVASRLASISARWVTEDVGLATFVAEQRYSLDAVPRREELTGSAMFSFATGEPRLMLFHLGAPATAKGADEPEPRLPSRPGESLPDELRRRRKEQSLSLRDLAARASLSASFLSQLERGLADPSISSLRRLAHALDVDVHVLLGEHRAAADPIERVVVRREYRPKLHMPHAGATYELLAPERARSMDASLVTLEPSEGAWVPAGTDVTEEFILVLEGSLSLEYGYQKISLRPGDSAYLDNTMPQRLAAGGAESVSFLAVAISREESEQAEHDEANRSVAGEDASDTRSLKRSQFQGPPKGPTDPGRV